jgi:predicted phage-related endonuclease
MNLAGVVMGLEVSRLARNRSVWHQLPEICALTRTLRLDEDDLYDPSSNKSSHRRDGLNRRKISTRRKVQSEGHAFAFPMI